MPDRPLREGIKTSVAMTQVNWFGQVLYLRLLVTVDDFGRYDARPAILRAYLFPLDSDKVRDAEVSRGLADCEKAGLLRVYGSSDRPVLVIEKWRNKPRAKKSKWPQPPAGIEAWRVVDANGNAAPGTKENANDNAAECLKSMQIASNCEQMHSDASACPQLQADAPETETETEIPPKSPKGDEPLEFPAALDTERFRAKWAEYEAHRRESRYKKLTERSVRMQLASLADHGEAIAIAAIDLTMANGWRGIFPEKVAEMRSRPGNPPARLSNAMPSEPSPDRLPAMVASWAQELNTYLMLEPNADARKRAQDDGWAVDTWNTAIARLAGHKAQERAFFERVRGGLTDGQWQRMQALMDEINQQAAKEAA